MSIKIGLCTRLSDEHDKVNSPMEISVFGYDKYKINYNKNNEHVLSDKEIETYLTSAYFVYTKKGEPEPEEIGTRRTIYNKILKLRNKSTVYNIDDVNLMIMNAIKSIFIDKYNFYKSYVKIRYGFLGLLFHAIFLPNEYAKDEYKTVLNNLSNVFDVDVVFPLFLTPNICENGDSSIYDLIYSCYCNLSYLCELRKANEELKKTISKTFNSLEDYEINENEFTTKSNKTIKLSTDLYTYSIKDNEIKTKPDFIYKILKHFGPFKDTNNTYLFPTMLSINMCILMNSKGIFKNQMIQKEIYNNVMMSKLFLRNNYVNVIKLLKNDYKQILYFIDKYCDIDVRNVYSNKIGRAHV